jgi:opacity protein-like surface antigen
MMARPREQGADATPAPATEGLDRLDRERASSLADEGGAAGAAVESEDAKPEDDTPTPARPLRARETIPGPDGRPIDRWSEEGRRRARRLRKGLFAIALLALASSAQAGAYLTPFAGAAFGGDSVSSPFTYGGSLTLAGDVVGFAVDFGYTKDFFGDTAFGDNNMTTLMGNLVVLTPGRTRLYGSAGLGLMKTSVEDASGFFDVDSNELGFDVGGGVLFMAGEHIGIQGDIRYFRQLTDPEPDNEFDIDLGSLDFWRATGGLAIRF